MQPSLFHAKPPFSPTVPFPRPILLLLLIFLLSLPPTSLSLDPLSELEISERDALLTLYQRTTPSSWTRSTNWGSNTTHHCDWFGIQCQDATGTTPPLVSSLRLSSNNLRTDAASPIPFSLSALSALNILQLFNNTNLAFTIRSLPPTLVFVQLSHTSLSGPLPSSLSKLTNLFSLDVSSTLVTGPFPASLSQLCTRQPSGFSSVDCNVADTPLFLYPCGAGSIEGDRLGNCRSGSDYGKTNWDYLTCLPCPHCSAFGDCTDGFDSYKNMCTVCPVNTFDLYGSCNKCPSNSFAAFLLPASIILSILIIVGIGVALTKAGLAPSTFSLTLANTIRLKQIGAAFQILTVFAQVSAILAPWFLSVAGIFLIISAPVEVQPVCASWYSKLIRNEYYFLRSYVALAALSLLSSILRYAHKVRAASRLMLLYVMLLYVIS